MVAAKYGHLNLVEFYLNNGSDSSIQAEVRINLMYGVFVQCIISSTHYK